MLVTKCDMREMSSSSSLNVGWSKENGGNLYNFSNFPIKLKFLFLDFAFFWQFFLHVNSRDKLSIESRATTQQNITMLQQHRINLAGLTTSIRLLRNIMFTLFRSSRGDWKFRRRKCIFKLSRKLHILETELDLKWHPRLQPIIFDWAKLAWKRKCDRKRLV